MQVRADRLAEHLARGLDALYVVSGDEPLLVMESVDAIRAAARAKGFQEREVLNVEAGFDWGRLRVAGASLSLFASRRLIELRIPSGKPGTEGAQTLEAFASHLPPDTLTLVVLPRINLRGDKAGWYQALLKAGTLVEIEPVDLAALPAWLGARLARQGQSADAETLRFLAEQVEGNLLAAHQEIQKLGLLYPPRRLSFEEVSEAVLDVSRFDVFSLADAMLAGDVARMARILDGLMAAGEKPQPVLGVLAWTLRALARARRALDAGADATSAVRGAGLWGERQNLARRRLPRLSAQTLAAALEHAAEIDRMSKGLKSGDVWDELLQLGLRIARPQ
jgi:DNA polymerase-3 subunit delta